jgi:hypothetical protein
MVYVGTDVVKVDDVVTGRDVVEAGIDGVIYIIEVSMSVAGIA